MKKRTVFMCAALAFTVFLSMYAAFGGGGTETFGDLTEAAASYPENKDTEDYVIKEEDGSVVIEYGREKLETSISTSGLREYDRELLKNGITVFSYDEVLMLLEDFNS